MIVNIPGGTAEIREKPTVGGRDAVTRASLRLGSALRKKRPELMAKVDAGGELKISDLPLEDIDEEVMGALQYSNRVGVVSLLKSWSLPDALPTMETVDEMDADVFDAISQAIAPVLARVMQGEKWGAEGARDPSSPTEPSPASDGGARAREVPWTGPTTTPSLAGASTATGAS